MMVFIDHYYKDRRIFDKSCGPADIFTDDMMTSVSKYIALNIAREVDKGITKITTSNRSMFKKTSYGLSLVNL